MIAELQVKCRDCGPFYTYYKEAKDEKMRKANVTKAVNDRPRGWKRLTVNGVLVNAQYYALVDGLLYRRVNTRDGEELRICAPTGALREAFVLTAPHPVEFRRELMLHYHNGLLGNHVGREQTLERLGADWWWPGMRGDVDKWIKMCLQCRGNYGVPHVSAWTRSTLYSHPFRALQFDTITCRKDPITGHQYVLTVVDLFSRWCWAIPLMDRTAPEIGAALLREVMAPFYVWPHVFRSDNAVEFLGNVIAYLNAKLEIDHITGATYHPESQGVVERMHRKMNDMMRGIFAQVIEKSEATTSWVDFLPFVVGHLRAQKMAVLGGRSPIEVVMGLQPKLPQVLSGGLPVQDIGVQQYVVDLLRYLEETHRDIKANSRELAAAREAVRDGSSRPLEEGDIVLRRRPETDRPKGSSRFEDRTDGVIYRVHRRRGQNSYELEYLDGSVVAGARGKTGYVSGDQLVLCDMPELSVERPEGTFTRIEVQDREDHNTWYPADVVKFLVDGRVMLRYDHDGSKTLSVDLTKHRYRWLH